MKHFQMLGKLGGIVFNWYLVVFSYKFGVLLAVVGAFLAVAGILLACTKFWRFEGPPPSWVGLVGRGVPKKKCGMCVELLYWEV